MRPFRADLYQLFTFLISLVLFTQVVSPVHSIEDALTPEEKIKRFKAQEKVRKKRSRVPEYRYSYINRRHSKSESLKHLAAIYGVTWAVYPLTQPDVVRNKGSWKNYRKNFGQLVFDKDEPFWNWFVHPISGSQLYLYYRANGYSRIDSLGMAAISSTLFEFTVEIYTEPASIQDLYQTPVIGSFLGVGLENLSLYLLNSGNAFGRVIGHIINPATLFWFYEGKVQVVPQTNFNNRHGLLFTMEF